MTAGSKLGSAWACIVSVAAMCLTIATAPAAMADPQSNFRDAVTSGRGATCPPLQVLPEVEQVALRINESNNRYYRHELPMQPISDPVPALKEGGYNASKAILLLGFGANEYDAIRGAVLQGSEAIPDCSFTDLGVSVLHDDELGYTMTAAVLAGRMQS